jgi:hypothetical protein
MKPAKLLLILVAIIVGALMFARLAFAAETIIVPPCGLPGRTTITQKQYAGLVHMMVNGVIVNVPPANGQDAFYGIVNGQTVGPAPGEFRFARASVTNCTCGIECTNNFAVSDFLVGPYPAANPSHLYTALLDFGAVPSDRLVFGIRDCGCFDNSGSLSVTLVIDADNDGIDDDQEPSICLGTEPNRPVNSLGCAPEQICPCSQPWGRLKWENHAEFGSCMKAATDEFVELGFISKQEALEIMDVARKSECGSRIAQNLFRRYAKNKTPKQQSSLASLIGSQRTHAPLQPIVGQPTVAQNFLRATSVRTKCTTSALLLHMNASSNSVNYKRATELAFRSRGSIPNKVADLFIK